MSLSSKFGVVTAKNIAAIGSFLLKVLLGSVNKNLLRYFHWGLRLLDKGFAGAVYL